MADESQPPEVDQPPTVDVNAETDGPDTVVEAGFPDPDEFEDYDNVDSAMVQLPDDSYDASAVVEGEDNEGCGCQ